MDATALREDARTLGRDLRRAIPETYRAYGQLHSATLAPGALSTSTKELIALAIAVTRECDGCIAAHAEGAVRGGATADEVAEAIGVAILMNGGPATVYGPRAYQAFQQFTAARAPNPSSTHTDHAHAVDRVGLAIGAAPPPDDQVDGRPTSKEPSTVYPEGSNPALTNTSAPSTAAGGDSTPHRR